VSGVYILEIPGSPVSVTIYTVLEIYPALEAGLEKVVDSGVLESQESRESLAFW